MRIAGVIDADGHVSEPAEMWEQYLPSGYEIYAPRRVRDQAGNPRNEVAGHLLPHIPQAPEWLAPGRPTGGFDPKARLVDMDAEGIERSILFPTTGLFFGGVEDPEIEAVLCRAYNDWLADYRATDPERLVGVAMVSQGDVDAAVAEVRRAATDLGCVGVMVRPNVLHGRNLDHPDYEPLWAAVEELGITLSVHEGTTLNVAQSGDRFDTFAFRHACSHPHEQQMGLLSLICGGVLERHPGMRVVFLESGCGWVPAWLERLDEHMEHWRHATTPLPARAVGVLRPAVLRVDRARRADAAAGPAGARRGQHRLRVRLPAPRRHLPRRGRRARGPRRRVGRRQDQDPRRQPRALLRPRLSPKLPTRLLGFRYSVAKTEQSGKGQEAACTVSVSRPERSAVPGVAPVGRSRGQHFAAVDEHVLDPDGPAGQPPRAARQVVLHLDRCRGEPVGVEHDEVGVGAGREAAAVAQAVEARRARP